MSGGRNLPIGTRWAYGVLGIVIVVALVLGSHRDVPQSDSQRIAYLESILKCPDCADLTIAQSQSAAAAGLRAKVTQLVRSGESNAQIETFVVVKYSSAEILTPHGGSGAVAVAVPIAAFAIAATVIAVTLARRRRTGGPTVTGVDVEDLAIVTAALNDRRGAP